MDTVEVRLRKTNTMLYASIILIVILVMYISKQEYNTACDRRVMDIGVVSRGTPRRLPPIMELNTVPIPSPPTVLETTLEKNKKVIEPELDVLKSQVDITDLQKIDDPLSTDVFADLKSSETTDDRAKRNIVTASTEGPQLEGMKTPVDTFEMDAMNRQLAPKLSPY